MIHKQHCGLCMQSARVLQITIVTEGKLPNHIHIATKVNVGALLMVITTN